MATEVQLPGHVQGLIKDATIAIDYHRFVGDLPIELPDALENLRARYVMAASGQVDETSRTANLALLKELEKQVAVSRATIPLESWGAMKSGKWIPGRHGSWESVLTVAISIFAIFLVISTGKLTVFHNNALAAQAELYDLAKDDVGKSYGRMLRLVHQAWGEADRALCVSAGKSNCVGETGQPQAGENQLLIPRQFDIARNTYFDTEADLSILTSRTALAVTSSETFTRPVERDLRLCARIAWVLPLPKSLLCPSATQDTNAPKKPGIEEQILACVGFEFGENWMEDVSGIGKIPDSIQMYSNQLFDLSRLLRCKLIVPFTRENIPPIQSSIAALKSILLPISLILLPALYGATGAVLAVLRRRLDFSLPNLGFAATLFRICRGAVIGVVLVWFVTPDSVLSSELTSLGLSLFAFVLLLGFAQDRLFEMLDLFADRLSSGMKSEGRSGEQKA
jgi:hypothetical protein